MNKLMLLFCVFLVFPIILSGCGLLGFGGNPAGGFIGSAMDKAANVAGDKVGQKVGDTVGTAMAGYADASLRGLSPALMQMYVSTIFSSVFYAKFITICLNSSGFSEAPPTKRPEKPTLL